ncbi:MAG TPA: hypothetical protein VHU24_03160 [Solirubrobacterales bacterium]|jgi:hypothetical protein|nr:hypothetical protein [Solirubrobacterales bacterium]
MDLKKKVGPLPLWAWIAVIAGVGYIAWRRAQSSEAEGVEEGIYPTSGVAAEPSSGTSTGGSGAVTAAEEFAQHAGEAGEARAIAAQEAAEGRAIGHEEAQETRTVAREEAAEGRAAGLEGRELTLQEWIAKQAAKAGVKVKPRAKKPTRKQHEGKGGKGKKAHEKTNGNTGQKHHSNHSNHQPGHVKKTDHRTAAPARTRVKHPAKARR